MREEVSRLKDNMDKAFGDMEACRADVTDDNVRDLNQVREHLLTEEEKLEKELQELQARRRSSRADVGETQGDAAAAEDAEANARFNQVIDNILRAKKATLETIRGQMRKCTAIAREFTMPQQQQQQQTQQQQTQGEEEEEELEDEDEVETNNNETMKVATLVAVIGEEHVPTAAAEVEAAGAVAFAATALGSAPAPTTSPGMGQFGAPAPAPVATFESPTPTPFGHTFTFGATAPAGGG
jgi:hypothetical protein